MKKKELLKLRTLNATSKMMQMADADVPQRTVYKSWNGEQVYLSYECSLYMRCQIIHGFLKAAFSFRIICGREGENLLMNYILIRKRGNLSPMTGSGRSG